MKIVYSGDSFVQKIIGAKQVKPDSVYRWSIFAVSRQYHGKNYLYQNFTKKSYYLDEESFTVDPEQRFSSDEINADSALQQLVADHFLVLENTDETALYESFCKIARALKMKKEGYASFTILPTTACNARCIYCYEQGIEFITMNEETLRQTIEFIKQVRDPAKGVWFSWFGGEPLIGEKMIDTVSAAMREANINYGARITTNGSLITSDIVKKMKNEWRIHRIQITLDGTEQEYNRRKNYYFNYDSAYWHVLSRIKMINDNGIKLNIRVNVDMGNIDTVPQMVEDLKNFISDPDNITFDLAPLFDLQASEDGYEIWKRSFEVAEEIMAMGFKIAHHYSVKRSKFNHCMADAPYKAIVIAPDGKLYNCENIMSFEPVGDVWNGVTNTPYIQMLNNVEPARAECKDCFSLPECTTFSHCGHLKVGCQYSRRKRMERILDQLFDTYENKYIIADEPDEEETIEADC